jgi:pectate lyase
VGWSILIGDASASEPTGKRFVQSAKQFADCVIENGRDRYGQTVSPLFVDGMHVETFEPIKWKFKGETWILSNFASQQPLVRLLDGLTEMTAQPKYRDAAEAATGYALKHTRTPNGLLYWGGHLSWDLAGEKGVTPQGNTHELKHHRPYFHLMWRVDSLHTKKLLETIWASHVVDWSRLDYNCHANCVTRVTPQWKTPFQDDIEVPYPAVGRNLSFLNTSVSLLHTGAMLAVLADDRDALTWSGRLARRWRQANHPKTGLSGARLSYRTPSQDRAKTALQHVYPDICEAQIVLSSFGRYRIYCLGQMQDGLPLIEAGEPYASLGHEFIEWASEDLKAYAEHCYDEKTGKLISVMTDGTPIRWRESQRGYFKPSSFAPKNPDGLLLWACATAYRLTHDGDHWRMVRNLVKQFDLGDPGQSGGQERALNLKTGSASWPFLYAMLELHEATGDDSFLRLATRIGDNIIASQAPSGLFPARSGGEFGRTGDERPLALLHLAGAIDGKHDRIPAPAVDNRFFHAQYHENWKPGEKRRGRIYDGRLYR